MTIRQSNAILKSSDTTITIEPLTIYASRLISNHLYRIRVNVDDIEDLITKVDRASSLIDDDFIEFDRIQHAMCD